MRLTHGVAALAAAALLAAPAGRTAVPAAPAGRTAVPAAPAGRTAAPAATAARTAARTTVETAARTAVGTATQAAALKAAVPAGTAELIPAVATAPMLDINAPSPLSVQACLTDVNVRCYSPVQYQAAYNLARLYKRGINGKGETIAIIESYGSPTIRHDLGVFDKQWGLPDPTLNIFTTGQIPAFDAKNQEMLVWAQETSLDVEYAHALAPGATIDLVETSVPETEGLQGIPQIVQAEQSLIDREKPAVISQSFGATEDTLPGFATGDFSALTPMRTAFTDAQAHHITMLAASGDTGATAPGPDGVTLYRHQAVSWPASDPLVTAVGGTQLTLNQSGTRTAPDAVWSDSFGASGGGLSAVFARPLFQSGVASVTGDHRGVPDIAMAAAVDGAAWTYGSYQDAKDGWQLFGGTSEATPLFAGIVALADQLAGHPLGDINPALYALGAQQDPASTGIVPVTTGTNSFGGVPGFAGQTGYSLAVGWGTINAAVFVPALVNWKPTAPVLLNTWARPLAY
jgi:subtilase family serine protease